MSLIQVYASAQRKSLRTRANYLDGHPTIWSTQQAVPISSGVWVRSHKGCLVQWALSSMPASPCATTQRTWFVTFSIDLSYRWQHPPRRYCRRFRLRMPRWLSNVSCYFRLLWIMSMHGYLIKNYEPWIRITQSWMNLNRSFVLRKSTKQVC